MTITESKLIAPPPPDTRCGVVAIVGRPNVGKSTLLNHIMGCKLSITSRRPQTTRHRILGISSSDSVQTVFVDTPGLHGTRRRPLNRLLDETARKSLQDVDLVLLVCERLVWNDADQRVLEAVLSSFPRKRESRTDSQRQSRCPPEMPVILIINKVDALRDKRRLLPHIEKLSRLHPFAEIVPLSALGGHNLPELQRLVAARLPSGPFLFPAGQITDRSPGFLAAELIREKVTRQLGDELPYEARVEIEKFQQEEARLNIDALLLVAKAGQKRILIGRDGARLKRIGSAARQDLERAFACPVMLNLWVKLRGGWADDVRALRALGYGD